MQPSYRLVELLHHGNLSSFRVRQQYFAQNAKNTFKFNETHFDILYEFLALLFELLEAAALVHSRNISTALTRRIE